MSFIKEISAKGDQQAALKTSDATDAGAADVAAKPMDVKFSLMRNMINNDGNVTGSDINDFLEKSQELNDEVDTVGYAIETDDGDIIKVYVNATQAEDFEAELSKMLGLDNDSEVAINELAAKFDIIDVVWPDEPAEDEANDDITIDDSDLFDAGSEYEPEPESESDLIDEPIDDDEDVPSEDAPKMPLVKDIAKDDVEELLNDDDIDLELDDEGNPIVDDKDNTKKKKKKTDDTDTPNTKDVKEDSMNDDKLSVGGAFLKRITEAEEVMMKDTAWKGLHARLKRPYEKKIVELFQAIGIPGRIAIREEGLQDGIEAGGDILRRGGRKQTLFNKMFDLFTTGGEVAESLVEAKKRGGRVQKILETVLVRLGLPEGLTTTDGAGVLATVFSRAASKVSANSELEATLTQFAKTLGITTAEVNESVDAEVEEIVEEIVEEVDVGTDDYMMAVVDLCLALGVPERNLQYQRPQLVKSLRTKKQSLSGRGMIEQRMATLGALVAKNTRTPANAAPVTEAFSPLEALTKHDIKHVGFKLMEPEGGPAMMASYESKGTHEETIISIGVDPEITDDNKSLRVSIDSPWQDDPHIKNFPNTRAGYKLAVDYAEKLRMNNPKTGGRPKGWKES